MNTTKQEIIECNNTKINYFNLLVKKNKINISCDIFENKIKPYLSKKLFTLQFLNNIVYSKYIENLVDNFSEKTQNYLKNKSKRNFENLLNTNREKVNKKFIKQLTDTLNLSKTKIPTSKTLNFYYSVYVSFDGNSFLGYLIGCLFDNLREGYYNMYDEYDNSLTLKILKTDIIKEFTDKLTNVNNTYLLTVYDEYLKFRDSMTVKQTLQINIRIDINLGTDIEIETELEKLF
jgi:hypothetical protein